jgi:hypothetical protein
MPISPLDFAKDLLERAEKIAANAGTPSREIWSVESDMLRSAWVLVGASIDTYFHERVRGSLVSRPMTGAAKKYALQLGPVEDLIDLFLKDRAKSRPRVALKNILHDTLLRDTFQGSTNVERAFNLLGVQKPWKKLEIEVGDTQANIKGRLDKQYNRRNRIAHQGDYRRQERPRTIFYEAIGRSDVDGEVNWTRDFLTAADRVN